MCSIKERLKQYPESLSNEGCLEYTPTGEIITLQSASVSNTPTRSRYRCQRYRNRRHSKSPPDESSSDPKSGSNACNSFSIPSKPSDWELTFSSNDDPAASCLQQTLDENFGDGLPDLQNFINGEIFEDALSDINSTYNISSFPITKDNSCSWSDYINIAGYSSNSVYDRYSDLSVPLVNEHEFWDYGTFLTNPTVSRCFYQGILDHCAHFDINANKVADTLPIKPQTFRATDHDYKSL